MQYIKVNFKAYLAPHELKSFLLWNVYTVKAIVVPIVRKKACSTTNWSKNVTEKKICTYFDSVKLKLQKEGKNKSFHRCEIIFLYRLRFILSVDFLFIAFLIRKKVSCMCGYWEEL